MDLLKRIHPVKKNYYALIIFSFLISCGSNQNGKKSSEKKNNDKTSTNPESDETNESVQTKKVENLPYYFIAIHMEPEENLAILDSMYTALKTLVTEAEQYNMKLTIMFGHTWADYLTDQSKPERQEQLEKWKLKHEVSSHHHSIYHPYQWDGYSHLNESDALIERAKSKTTQTPEIYKGSMQDYMAKIKKIDPNIKSGCLNEERSKAYIPKEIIYLTCSGYQNFGEAGTYAPSDINVKKGINEFISVSQVDGINRKWLAHASNISQGELEETKAQFSAIQSGVYGVVTHGFKDENRDEITPLINFMKYINEKDPQGFNSKTVSEVIQNNLIPEQKINMTEQNPPNGSSVPSNSSSPCGDGKCDEKERSDRNLCPEDYDKYCH